MSIRDLMNKQKLICDDIVSITLIIMFVFLFFFFRRIAIMSFGVFPFSSLAIYGIIKIYHVFFDNELNIIGRVIYFVLGLFFISFAILILSLIFLGPYFHYILYFLSIVLILVGLAGILKGLIVKTYSLLYRRLNVYIGFLSLTFSFLGIYYAEVAFLFYLISLIALLASNALLRSALYLSEYGLSLKKISNLRFVFHIMDTYQLKLPENEESD